MITPGKDKGGGENNSEIPDFLPEDKGDSGFLKKCFFVVGGLVLIVLGIVGWVLPFLMGVPLIAAGLAMAAVAIPGLRKLVNSLEAKLPRKWRLYLRPKKKGDGPGTLEGEVGKFFPIDEGDAEDEGDH